MVQHVMFQTEAREPHKVGEHQNKHNRKANSLLTDVNSHQIHKSSKLCLAQSRKCSNIAV